MNVRPLMIGCLVVLACGLAPVAGAQVMRDEIHLLGSVTTPDADLFAGRRGGVATTLGADLRIPRAGPDKLAAVVLLHGGGGVGGWVTDWERELNAMGLATLRVDSFTGRGLITTFNDPSQFGPLNMMVDAWRALELLEKHPRIDPERVALMGFSLGASAVKAGATLRFQRAHGAASQREFAAYIAFYASCSVTYRDDDVMTAKPVRMFHGAADDWAPVAPCRDFVARAKGKGADIMLTEYPGAHHVFDFPPLLQPLKLAEAPTLRGCRLEEGPDHSIVNAVTRLPFTWQDPCVEHGTTVAYDQVALVAARKAVKEFLTATLKP